MFLPSEVISLEEDAAAKQDVEELEENGFGEDFALHVEEDLGHIGIGDDDEQVVTCPDAVYSAVSEIVKCMLSSR